jgi:glutamine synthetase
MVRIPYGRLEYRLPDSSCNPYLVHASIIAAGLDGIDRELDPGAAHNINLYGLSNEQRIAAGVDLLPQNLGEAVEALAADTQLIDLIGPEICNEFINLKRDEWIEYCRYVTEWERKRYLELF